MFSARKCSLLPIGCLMAALTLIPLWAAAQTVKVGAGAYVLTPKGGDPSAPSARMRTDAMLKTAAQTNQWYSSLIFSSKPEVIYAQPLTFLAAPTGLELALPAKEVVPTERRDVEIHYPHKDPLTISPTAFLPGPAKLAKATDWSIDISMASGADEMRTTIAHGGPYAQIRLTRGDARIRLPSAAERVAPSDDARVLWLRSAGRLYGVFGPTGVQWEQASSTEWIARLPEASRFLSASVLPDDLPSTRALFIRHAYSFIEDTRVSWQVDRPTGEVTTRFQVNTTSLEGPDAGPLLGLYPHHWHDNSDVLHRLGPAYDSVRGKIRLLAASSFNTKATYTGFVPWWPAVSESGRGAELKDLMKADLRNARRMMLEIGNGPYWQGKGLQRILKLLDVVQAQGDAEGSAQLMKLLKGRIESWFSGEDRKTYFHVDRTIGSVLAHPEEYFSIEQMNDHHFHYGYWIRTVAELALRDPAWAARDRWGSMVDLLVSDIATTRRGGQDFPFLRTFDPYEGHSWASGIGLGGWGNNQESSSEAVNAWAGLILWGEINADAALRDLGIWLYTNEIRAIEHYWFDRHRLVFPPEYRHVETSMVFGGKYAHNTWWTDEPRQIKGINLLPITTASTYLGVDPAFIKRSLGTLETDTKVYHARGKRADPPDIWQDLFAKTMALADPATGLSQWNRWGAVELGDTRSHTLHWLLSLQEMGTPDLSVTADTTLFSVFRRPDGRKTYLAYNVGPQPVVVRFSDGQFMTVAPRTLERSHR
jgi:endoglucanase Acf2